MFDTGMTMLENSIPRVDLTEEIPGLIGSRHPSAAPHNIYKTADSFIAILIIENNSWKKLASVMGLPHLGDDPDFATSEARLRNNDRVDEIMEEWTRSKTSEEIAEIFKKNGFPSGVVYNVKEVMASEQAKAREMVVTVDQPQMGPVKIPGCPIKFSETPVEVKTPAPLAGQHTREILTEMLDYSLEDYLQFREKKIV